MKVAIHLVNGEIIEIPDCLIVEAIQKLRNDKFAAFERNGNDIHIQSSFVTFIEEVFEEVDESE